MKRIAWVLLILALASLACATLAGGGNDAPVNAGGDGSNAPNSGAPANDPANEPEDEPANAPNEESAPDTAGPSPATDWACYNPFYPLGVGPVYYYRASYADPSGAGGMVDTEYQLETIAQNDESLTVEMRFDELTSEVTWLCDEGGMFSNGFAQFNFQFLEDIEIETVSYEGVSLPKEEDWFVGSTWDTDYEINMSYSIEGIEITSHVVGEMDNEVIAIEPVSVPAGNYSEAYVVKTTGQFIISVNLMGTDTSSTIPMEMTSWYVKNVGMVKQTSTDEYGTSLTELVEIE
jgi:hypothetical protein